MCSLVVGPLNYNTRTWDTERTLFSHAFCSLTKYPFSSPHIPSSADIYLAFLCARHPNRLIEGSSLRLFNQHCPTQTELIETNGPRNTSGPRERNTTSIGYVPLHVCRPVFHQNSRSNCYRNQQ